MKCCFCGKELPNRREWNNPEPLNQERDTVCCPDCNTEYVIPVRRILWCSWVSKDEYNKLLNYFQSISLKELRALLIKHGGYCTIEKYQEILGTIFGENEQSNN